MIEKRINKKDLFMLNGSMDAETYSNDIINTKRIFHFVTHPKLTLTSNGATIHTENFMRKHFG